MMVKTPESFIAALRAVHMEHVFNPYSDRCMVYDHPDAPALRRENLRRILDVTIHRPVHSLWIARDLGYLGGRRTGLALTDEMHLAACSKAYGDIVLSRATVGNPLAERTAEIVWQMLTVLPKSFFLWNVFPFHPHERGKPLSNRSHTAQERAQGVSLLGDLLEMVRPQRIVAIGNDAHKVVARLGWSEYFYVRHPSYGGQHDFIAGIKRLYTCRGANFRQRNDANGY